TWSKSWTIVVPTLILVGLGIALTLPSRPKGSNQTFVRLTSDAGLTTDPMVSRDGSLLVYASDRGDTRLHIWVQQLSPDGQATQVTRGDADEHQPAFSPDATKVAFRSEINGGGIYVVPTLGRQPVHGEFLSQAAIGVSYKPRQCGRQRYESRPIGDVPSPVAGSGNRPSSPACVRYPL